MFEHKKKDTNADDVQELEVDAIKKVYNSINNLTLKNELYYLAMNDNFYYMFEIRAKQIINEPKLLELNKKFELSPYAKFKEETIKFNKYMDEYKEIFDTANSERKYYKEVLLSFYNSMNKIKRTNEKLDVKEKYTKICEEIIDTRLKSIINYEKKIINLKDKFINLNIDI